MACVAHLWSLPIKLFEGEDVWVVRRGPWSNAGPCVVTFDCYQVASKPDRPGFGEAFFEGRGVDAIHILSRENDWYQSLELDRALGAVRESLADRSGRVCAYGVSMGGYAALRFARLLGAQTAIALAPQFSIHPSVAPFDRRWRESSTLRFRPEINGVFEPPPRTIVIYDPSVPEDAAHAALIMQQGPIEPAPILYAGHSAGLMLAQVQLLGEFVIEVLEGGGDVRRLVRTARQRRRNSAQYWASLARRASVGRLAMARQMAARAVELAPNYDEYRSEQADYERRWSEAQACEVPPKPLVIPKPRGGALFKRVLRGLLPVERGR
jgi:pimeloyl-ACP methyl ester carboxylesterase